MSIVYDYCGGLYINLTNRCPCRCEFCVKNYTDGLGSADSLMIEIEPSVEEVIEELGKWPVANYDEIVFCGYGEPTERLEEMLHLAAHIKKTYGKPIRLNTIGLSDLIWGCETAPRLEGLIDTVSVSMNEADEEKYMALCHPRFGKGSYAAMLKYIEDAKKYVPHVAASVVGCISHESIEACRQKARELGIGFRVR
ncbi:MAG: TatD family nuclease-associated radical SAM protein [Bacillota bacterium]|nr:TatD family nuclease-associated radical SAM protein [Bacillota bacterium]